MKKNKKRSEEDLLSPAELSMLHAEIQNSGEDRSKLPPHDTSNRASAIRFAKKNPIFIVCISVILLFVIGAIIFGGIMLARYIASRPNTSDFTVYLGKESYEMPYEDAMRDGTLYVDMKKIAVFAGMITSGSEEKIKFTASSDQYLRFENNSEYAVINGCKVEMSAKAIVNKESCLVPFQFLQKAISQGIRLKLDSSRNIIKITRQLYRDTKAPADMLFVTDGFPILQAITVIKTEIGPEAYPIDISPYLAYINPENANEYLVLANKQNALTASYKPSDLVVLKSDEINVAAIDGSLKLRYDAAYALKAMMLAMATENPALVDGLLVTSAYRSYERQESLHNGYIAKEMAKGLSFEEAEQEVLKYSARPGESEHQTGLCFDFITEKMNGILDERFEEYPAFAWLKENAHLYGFILRYPEDKVDITGYQYEPWHFRFVGRDAAVEIYESGLCLEEYLDLN